MGAVTGEDSFLFFSFGATGSQWVVTSAAVAFPNRMARIRLYEASEKGLAAELQAV